MRDQLIEKVLKIGEKRRRILTEMQVAIYANDKDQVFVLAQKLTGLSDEERLRVNPRFN